VFLLLDIGNTNTHVGLSTPSRVTKQSDIPTAAWFDGRAGSLLEKFAGRALVEAAALCSVVPRATPFVSRVLRKKYRLDPQELTSKTIRALRIKYPRPASIGPDRLANALAVRHCFGAPAVVVDFGTAVTFDIVDGSGAYVGGIIAPGLAAMTDYLHEKTALLPRIRVREIKTVIGKSTEQAMLIGAVHGYRGLIRGLIKQLQQELKTRLLPVIATGGYARLMAAGLPEITLVDPLLTLEGLRLFLTQARPS
jgi:type III pantothenate kinase